MTRNCYNMLRKVAYAGFTPTNKTLTEMFAQLQNQQMRDAVLGSAFGVGGGAIGGAIGGGINLALKYKEAAKEEAKAKLKKKIEDKIKNFPKFDKKSGAYVGQYIEPPQDKEALQKLHKKLTGKEWEASAPKWLEWALDDQEHRIAKSIREAIQAGKADTKGLSTAEIASLVYPKILLNTGEVKNKLGFFDEYPTKGLFKARALTAEEANNEKR